MVNVTVPLIAHVIHALGVGGLENGLVNLINRMPADRYRHAILCMTEYTDFRSRIRRDDVEVIALRRGSVPLWRTYVDLVAHFRRLKPTIVHTRNLSGLDALIPALIAGVRLRVHGEHGRDADDLDGLNPRNLRLRRMFRPFVTRYTAVSLDLAGYLARCIHAPEWMITQIYNGVDTETFYPAASDAQRVLLRQSADETLIGTVGRLQDVKNQSALVDAFAHARALNPQAMRRTRLVIVGDGPSRSALDARIRSAGLLDAVTLTGERSDIPEVLRELDLFVLPSLNEGISNTVLEAMATGLPVLATRVGGNPELVVENETGQLVNPGDRSAMAEWIIAYVEDRGLRRRHGIAGRKHVEVRFSMQAMVASYLDLYDRLHTDPIRRRNGGSVL